MSLMTQKEFALIKKVNKSTVTRWIQNGRIALVNGLIDSEQAERSLIATESPFPHHRARKELWDEQRQGGAVEMAATAAPVATNATVSNEQLGYALKTESYRLQKAKAELANLELDRLARTVLDRQEVEKVLSDLAEHLKSLLDAIPAKLTSEIVRLNGDPSLIREEITTSHHHLLHELSTLISRKAIFND